MDRQTKLDDSFDISELKIIRFKNIFRKEFASYVIRIPTQEKQKTLTEE